MRTLRPCWPNAGSFLTPRHSSRMVATDLTSTTVIPQQAKSISIAKYQGFALNRRTRPLSSSIATLRVSNSFSSNAEVYDDSNEDHECQISISLHDNNIEHNSFNNRQSSDMLSKIECSNVVRENNNNETNAPHCKTCTCNGTHDSTALNQQKNRKTDSYTQQTSQVPEQHQTNHDSILQQQTNSQSQTCHLPSPLMEPNTPLPPPLPNPTYSFKRRVLPSNLTAFTSAEGKERFLRSLTSNFAEAYFPISQQFLNQSDPAYCGVTTLVVVLNALAMDPNVRWRGGWRWYGDESMLLERCCLEEERVKREGISIEMFGGLARCQGVDVVLKRPSLDVVSPYLELPSEKRFNANADNIQSCSIDVFRKDIITAVCNPPRTEWDEDAEHIVLEQSSNKRFFIVTSFSRSSLRQTGEGHFSPIAAYDPTTDSCLVMDVARFKYAPYWVSVQDLFDAMIPLDAMTEKSRGWILMYPPHAVHKGNAKAKTVGEQEGKRPAACVPMAGSGTPLCPVEKIKVGYCSVDKSRS